MRQGHHTPPAAQAQTIALAGSGCSGCAEVTDGEGGGTNGGHMGVNGARRHVRVEKDPQLEAHLFRSHFKRDFVNSNVILHLGRQVKSIL